MHCVCLPVVVLHHDCLDALQKSDENSWSPSTLLYNCICIDSIDSSKIYANFAADACATEKDL